MCKCERCQEPTRVTIMSMFNTQMICISCKEIEREHPRYKEAERRELEECSKGNYNFGGIGLEE
jgi:hypothetical protein